MIAVDHILRIVVVVLACLFIIRYASLYEEEYNKKLIEKETKDKIIQFYCPQQP